MSLEQNDTNLARFEKWYNGHRLRIERSLVVPEVIHIVPQDVILHTFSTESGVASRTVHEVQLDILRNIIPVTKVEIALEHVFEYEEDETKIRQLHCIFDVKISMEVDEGGKSRIRKKRSGVAFGHESTTVVVNDLYFSDVDLSDVPRLEFRVVGLGRSDHEEHVIIGP